MKHSGAPNEAHCRRRAPDLLREAGLEHPAERLQIGWRDPAVAQDVLEELPDAGSRRHVDLFAAREPGSQQLELAGRQGPIGHRGLTEGVELSTR